MILVGENQGTWRETYPTASLNNTNLTSKGCLWQMVFLHCRVEIGIVFFFFLSSVCVCVYIYIYT